MIIFWLAAVFAVGLVSLAQRHRGTSRPGPADLVKPLPGAPLIAEQVEERARRLPTGESAVEVTSHAIYRDSAGRMRIQSVPNHPDELPAVAMIDPTSGSRVVLSEPDKIAYRVMGPKAGENGFAYGFAGMGEALPSAHWRTSTEDLGRGTIDGNEFEGTRVTQTVEGESGLTNKIELWYSSELQVTGLAVAAGPYGTHTARIQNLRRAEPDPALFTIPADYRIVDLKASPNRDE